VGYVSDVHLEVPARRAALDVDSVIEIARRFAVDRNDRQISKIAAARSVSHADRARSISSFCQDIVREAVGKMMLSDQDFHVYAEVARAPENLHNAAGGSNASAREAGELNVDDCAIEIVEADFGIWFGIRCRSAFFAWRNYDFLQDAGFVWAHYVTIAATMENADDGGVSAIENADDAAFGACGARCAAAATMRTVGARLNSGFDLVAVHGIAQMIRWNKQVAVDIWAWLIRHDETVTVAMRDQAADDDIAIPGRRFRGGFGGYFARCFVPVL
jgi:hypothetical protein